MKKDRKTRRRSEDGIALLIAIFVLLLISVVAIALLVSSGTETALGANYRSSSRVYFAALAGLEEARGRLLPLPKNPNSFVPSVISATAPLPLGQTIYMINRLPGESIAPWDSSNKYYDNEYQSEFGVAASSAAWQSVYSVWDNNVQGIPGPLFKWVRINAVTDTSLHTEINYSTGYHPGTAVYYDPAHVDSGGNPWPSLIVNPSPPSTAVQALEITAFAALPNGSQKILQYLVAAITPNLIFPSAITLDGNGVQYTGPGSSQFYVDGNDETHASPLNEPPNGCAPTSPFPSYPAIGYLFSSDLPNIRATPPGNYQGQGGTSTAPSLGLVTVSPYLQSVGQLNKLVQTLTVNADRVITGPATAANMPSGMTATNPMIVVVNGDLDLYSWHSTGYGILLVTGELKYDPDAYWNGIVLVIGKGKFTFENNGLGTIYGALLIAQTVDSLGNPLASPGAATVAYASGNGGVGVYYSSCWVQYVQAPISYKVLSFHEIPK
ncbi:MAG: pilus assembly PilX family protein [Candidatus Acidiferrales bacterium]